MAGPRARDRRAPRVAVLAVAVAWAALGYWFASAILVAPLEGVERLRLIFGSPTWVDLGLPVVAAALYAASGRRPLAWVVAGVLLVQVATGLEAVLFFDGGPVLAPIDELDPPLTPDLVGP